MKFKLIGLSGKLGVGKDYIFSHYLKPNGYYQVSLAWHFKIWLASRGVATYEELFHTKPPHIRKLLQEEGTERGRDVFGQNIWIDTMFNWMKLYNETWGIDKFSSGDIRFVNECEAIKERGGKIYRIVAPDRNRDNSASPEARNHISETNLDDYTNFDGYIYNDYDAKNIPEQLKLYGVI